MLTGCVQRAFFPDVNAATARVLAAEGCDVVLPRAQGCCGALSVHTGREAEAQRFARSLIDAFEDAGVDYLVVNAAGCGSSLKEYGDLLRDDPSYAERAAALAAKVRDVSEVLVELGPVAPRHPLPLSVAYHDACHLAHAQGVRAQPHRLLADIPGLSLREILGRDLLRLGRGVERAQPRAGSGARRPQGARRAGHRRRPPSDREPRLPDAGGRGGPSCRWRDRSGTHRAGARRIDPRIAGAIAAALLIPAVI
jgi:glycolate oxidase iron-sulfur subunit